MNENAPVTPMAPSQPPNNHAAAPTPHQPGKLPLKNRIPKKWQYILLAIFVFIVAGAGIYFVFFSRAGTAMTGSDGEFTPLKPARILDTRASSNVGGITTLGAQSTKSVKILGQGGVPNTGVKAVVMNVTVANPTLASYLTVWQSGTSRPQASSLNFAAGQVLSNQVTVPVGSDGNVQIYNNAGNADAVFDVVGYFATTEGNPGSRYVAVNPDRIVDTRGAVGSTTLTASQTANVQITGNGSVPSAGVRAVVMNVTVVNPTAAGYLTIWPAGSTKPNVSSINFAANQVLSNQVTVPVGVEGKVTMFNYSGNTNVIYDVVGYYEDVAPGYDQTQAGRYETVTPTRVLDTRPTSGSKSTGTSPTLGGIPTLTADQTISFKLAGRANVPTTDVRAVTMNVTVVNPSAPGFLTVWPAGLERPEASSINFAAGQVLSNQITVPVSEDGTVQIYNLTGNTNVILDVLGYYVDYPASVNVNQYIGVGTELGCSVLEYDKNKCNTKVLSSNISYQSAGSHTRLYYNFHVNWKHNDDPTVGYYDFYSATYNIDFLASKVSIPCGFSTVYDLAGKQYSKYKPTCVSMRQTISNDSYADNEGNHETYNYDLPVNANNFKITTSVVTNIDNTPGTWVKYAMANPDAPTQDLLRVKIADTNLTSPLIAYLSMNVDSNGKCTSTAGDSLKVFNFMSNNKLIPITDYFNTAGTGNLVRIYNSSTPECPGVSKTQLARGSEIYEGYTDWGIVFRNNIPKDQRDTTKPIISGTQAIYLGGRNTVTYWDSVTQITTDLDYFSGSYFATAKATDNNLVTDFEGYVSDTNIGLSQYYCFYGATLDYINTLGVTFPDCNKVNRFQGKELYDVFNVTSIPYAPIRLVAKDNSGNESVMFYTPSYPNR